MEKKTLGQLAKVVPDDEMLKLNRIAFRELGAVGWRCIPPDSLGTTPTGRGVASTKVPAESGDSELFLAAFSGGVLACYETPLNFGLEPQILKQPEPSLSMLF